MHCLGVGASDADDNNRRTNLPFAHVLGILYSLINGTTDHLLAILHTCVRVSNQLTVSFCHEQNLEMQAS